ncbi:MAG: Protein-tyrosine-phosphatase [Herbinix sp.]|jgi:protein-tyrosine phosphatase|nr:Protein-tyrosine-phosphatase [Herbinix sp.]
MNGYFDIHNHLLPGLDDGSKSMEETRNMLLQAYEEGIRVITATPHYAAGRSMITADMIRAVLEEVTSTLEEETKEIEIILGNELEYNSEMIAALKSGEALTIDNTRYILVEFKPGDSYSQIRIGLYQCIMSGYIPILAHAERYHCLVKMPGLVEELVKLGAYIQINISSFLGRIFDSRASFCHKLMKRGLIHFLGTDAHGSKKRVPRMKKAIHMIRKRYGKEIVQRLLWDNPMIMLENKLIN